MRRHYFEGMQTRVHPDLLFDRPPTVALWPPRQETFSGVAFHSHRLANRGPATSPSGRIRPVELFMPHSDSIVQVVVERIKTLFDAA